MPAYALALLSAFAFALGLVLQQRGTLQTSALEGDPRFLRQVIHRPVWLLGVVVLVCGWVLQAAALRHGSLALVQSLQALSLVFALALGVRLTGQRVGLRSAVGAFITMAGIILLVVVGQPGGGISQPRARAWLTSGLIIAGLMLVLVLLGRRRRGSMAAAFYGTAAGLAFAFQAGVTKELVALLGHGVGAVFSSWPLYVFLVAEGVGFTLQQSALKCGVLAPAMAGLNAATLVVSVILGIAVFQESLSHDVLRLGPALAGLVMAVVGVVTLASGGQSCTQVVAPD
jgi:drug/metabolite transporter (DMT)-like permease